MKEFELKYGCNPNQKPSKIFMSDGSDLPIEILNGKNVRARLTCSRYVLCRLRLQGFSVNILSKFQI